MQACALFVEGARSLFAKWQLCHRVFLRLLEAEAFRGLE